MWDNFCFNQTAALHLLIIALHRSARTAHHRVRNRVLGYAFSLAPLFTNDELIVRYFGQVSRIHHLRHGNADVKIAQLVILIAELIDFLLGKRVCRIGCYKQNQHLNIEHILNKSVLFHFSLLRW